MTHNANVTIPTGAIVTVVKWYRPDRGFGFLSYAPLQEDIFVHFSTVEHYGLDSLETGDTVVCEVGPSERGIQVVRILDVKQDENATLPTRPIEEILEGALKWYSPKKGFGFIIPDDHGGDIFLHISILRRLHLDNLDPGTRLRAHCTRSDRGREAVEIEPLPPAS